VYLLSIIDEELVRFHSVGYHTSDPWEEMKYHGRFSWILWKLKLVERRMRLYKLREDMADPKDYNDR
jgi:hypothetical protein